MVGLLLSRSTSLLKISDAKGQTCLHVAAANGHYEMVQALLGQGSDQTMVDKVIMFKNVKYHSSSCLILFYLSEYNISINS